MRSSRSSRRPFDKDIAIGGDLAGGGGWLFDEHAPGWQQGASHRPRGPGHTSGANFARAAEDEADPAVERGGVVVVPAFAVCRAQHLLHLVARLRDAKRIPDCPVFLDSPMAINATKVFRDHREDHGLSEDECKRMCEIASYSQTSDDSKAIDRSSGPMIVISASGMVTGGRVLHHLQRFLPDARTTVLFVGYQAAGTRGRSLLDGANEIKLLGQYVPVKAKIVQLDGLSAHADYAEIIDWLRASKLSPKRVFVTHGEPAAADAMRRRLHDAFAWDAIVPELNATIELESRSSSATASRAS